MPAGSRSNRWYRCVSIIVVVFYLALATLYMFAIPAGESPDEPSHLQCIEQVSLLNRIPIIDPRPAGAVWWARERIISGLVCAHMPLYYFLAGYTQKLFHWLTAAPIHYEFPPNNPLWATGASVAMFVHPPEASFFTLREPGVLTVLRIESVLLGLVSILAAGRLARRIAPEWPEAALSAMVLVAGWPQFLFMSRAINNDGLAVALSAGVLAVLVEVGKPRRYVLASGLAVLAVLAKLTMVFGIAAVVFVWGAELVFGANADERRRLLRAGLLSAVVFGLLGLLLWFQPNLRADLQWSQGTMSAVAPQALTPTYWLNVLKLTLQSGWGRFGWMNLAPPTLQAVLWWAVLIPTGALGLSLGLRRSAKPHTRLVVLIACAWAACALASYLRIQVNRFQPQFRYLLAIVPVLAAFSGIGSVALLGAAPRWLQTAARIILLLALLAANLWIIFGLVAPAYA